MGHRHPVRSPCATWLESHTFAIIHYVRCGDVGCYQYCLSAEFLHFKPLACGVKCECLLEGAHR